MKEIEQFAERIDRAIERLGSAQSVQAGGHSAGRSDLEEENAELRSELEALKRQRAEDLAELDELLAQLRPMLEETQDA